MLYNLLSGILRSLGDSRTPGLQKDAANGLPKAEQEEVLAQEPKMRQEWDEKVGDRMIKLCIIGQKMDKAKITAELDALLD